MSTDADLDAVSPWALDGWRGLGILIGLGALVVVLYVRTTRKERRLLKSVQVVHESKQQNERADIVQLPSTSYE